jgi:hypothetical protein
MSAVGPALATGSPRAPRLDLLRSALAKLDAAPKLTPDPQLPKTPLPTRGGSAPSTFFQLAEPLSTTWSSTRSASRS